MTTKREREKHREKNREKKRKKKREKRGKYENMKKIEETKKTSFDLISRGNLMNFFYLFYSFSI